MPPPGLVRLNTRSSWRESVGCQPRYGVCLQRMPSKQAARPLSRDLVRMIREMSKKDALGLGEGLRAIEERQAKEIEFFLQACALRLETAV